MSLLRSAPAIKVLRQARADVRHVVSGSRRFLGEWRSSVGLPVRGPVEARPVTEALKLEVHEWSVYRSVLRAHFTVVERATGTPPKRAVILFGSRAVRVGLRRTPDQRLQLQLPAGHDGPNMGLAFELADGTTVVEPEPASRVLLGDPAGELFQRFFAEMTSMPAGRALEIGSRARSGTVYTNLVPDHFDYTGLDIVNGPNVDVVGDAHDLEASVGPQAYDVIFCVAVFEHLAMPWKAALSINRALTDGGLFFAGTHQTFPVHEAPWDFWRFSDQAWHSLFNAATGFEVLGAAMGEPADIVPRASKGPVWGIDAHPAFLASGVLARKIGEPRVAWPVTLAELQDSGSYPG